MNAIDSRNLTLSPNSDSCENAYAEASGLMATKTTGQPKGFDALQWLVISIGQRDEVASPLWGRFGRALSSIFPWHEPNHLADPKLEELRRMACLASSRGWETPPIEMAAFLRSGWSEDQLELLIETVAPPMPGFVSASAVPAMQRVA